MNTTGKHNRLRLTLFSLIFFLALAGVNLAQDVTISNLTQLVDVALSGNYSLYIPWTPWQIQAYPTDGGEPWWVDCSQVDCADLLSTSTNACATLQMHGITVTFATLARNILTGETLLYSGCSTDVIASIAAPSGYDPSTQLGYNAWVWRQWQQVTNCLDCWGLVAGEIPPPIVTLKTRLADESQYQTYTNNEEADAEAAAEAWALAFSSFTTGGGFTAMAGGMMMEMDDEEPCTVSTDEFAVISISQDTNGWTTVVVGPTCTNYLVGWFSVDTLSSNSLSTNVTWASPGGGWAGDGTSTFVDQTTPGVTQRFYRAILNLPTTNSDWNGDGIPDIWEANQGLNPFDPNTGSETSTNPWAHGLTNLQVYQNPSVLIANNYSSIGDGIPDWWRVMYFGVCTMTNTNSCATCDPDSDGLNNRTEFLLGTNPNVFDAPLNVIVNGGNPYTSSLTISIQTLSTNYPNVLISTDPLMSNVTVGAFSDGIATYTLSDNGDGLYNLYLQYADAAGLPHGVLMATAVTLDRLPPVVQITSPASNAVLNQAFITLQAVAADPNPVVPDAGRPLSIWINGQPFWDRNGTNIVIERFPVPRGTNSFTATILAVDLAGNTNTTSQTWAVNTSTATNAPNLLSVNLTSSMTLPNVNSIWVEGTVDNDYALINAIVYAASGDVITNLLNVSQNQYEGVVSLESGTNQVEVVAADAAGNTSSNVYTIISSTEFSGEITNPVLGVFATSPSNYVSGYVSALYDAGMPTQTNITIVTINGVAAVLGTNVDAQGNMPFWTTNMIPLGVPITGVVGGPGVPTDPPSLPPVQSQVYEVTAKTIGYDLVPDHFSEGDGATRPTYACGGAWFVYIGNAVISNEFDLSGGEDAIVVNEYENDRLIPDPGYVCTDDPANAPATWGPWSGFEYENTFSDTNPVRSLTFGSFPRAEYWCSYCTPPFGHSEPYEVYANGGSGESYWPWENQQLGSLTFTAPQQYGTNITVIFTFEGMQYTTPAGVTQDLSQVQFRGQSPIAYSNEAQTVSYLMTVTGGQSYTINQDSFQWPSFTTNYFQQLQYVTQFYSDTLHNLSWTNFHNIFVRISGPTNVCVSYTYQNANNSPPNTLISSTNQITLTATGPSNDDGTGIYTWSHPRGGTFSTNNCHAASTVVYSARELSSATPANASDKISLTYAYHGVSFTTNATLNILRPKTLLMGFLDYPTQPSCVGTGDTSFATTLAYGIYDQFGNFMPSFGMSYFETFSNFGVGAPAVGGAGSDYNGIQIGVLDVWGGVTNAIIAPGGGSTGNGHFGDAFFKGVVAANRTFWNGTTTMNPAFKADQKITVQGAEFSTGTIIWYCHQVMVNGSPVNSGAELFRGGSIITPNTSIPSNN